MNLCPPYRLIWGILLCGVSGLVYGQDSLMFSSGAVKSRTTGIHSTFSPSELTHHQLHHHGSGAKKVSRNSAGKLPDGCVEACASGCVYYGCAVGYEFVLSGMWNYHWRILDRKDQNLRAVSLDVLVKGGISPGNSWNVAPRIRGNWGLLSTDFRMFADYSSGPGFLTVDRSFDWQIVMFNWVALREVILRTGTGLMYVDQEDAVYNEFVAALEFYLWQEHVSPGMEVRFAPDYVDFETRRLEVNGGIDFMILASRNMDTFFSIGAMYQKNRDVGNRTSARAGFRFNLH